MKRETGNNRTAADKRVSIQLKLGGHSFSKGMLPKKLLEGDAKVEFSVLTHKCLLVPGEMFDERAAAEYLAIEGLGCAQDERAVCDFTEDGIVGVMAVSCGCADEICTLLGDRAVFTTPLVWHYAAQGKEMRIYTAGGVSFIKLYDGERLQYAEAVRTSDSNEVLYYIALLDGVFALADYTAYIRGESASETAKLIKRYFKKTKCE